MTQWGAGVHTYNKSEPGLPLGVAPPVAEFYVKAIQGRVIPSAHSTTMILRRERSEPRGATARLEQPA